MKQYKDSRDMPVWQKAFALLLKVYNLIKKFPVEEKFASADDLRRSANSVVRNIAEGYGRYEPKNKTRFYKVSRGSSYDATSQMLVADAQNYILSCETEEMITVYNEVIEEVNALIHILKKNGKFR